ncbi:hypothetical protein ES703_36409 [subsurface metagenome]
MKLTDRDKRVIEWVYLFRFLTGGQIRLLEFENVSKTACQRRLSLLYHNKYLSAIQKPTHAGYGSSKRVYCLSQRGKKVISFTHDGMDPKNIKWNKKNNQVEIYFLEHTLAVNDIRVAFTIYARSLGYELKWIPEWELKALKEKVRDPENPGKSLAVTPDGYFLLKGEGKEARFFIEADRATETNRRWKDKIRGYVEYVKTGQYYKRYKAESLRVLTITTTQERLKNLLATTKNVKGGNFFWFTTKEKIFNNNIIIDPLWIKNNKQELLALWYNKG